MRKILLFLEDYQEMSTLQSLLMKFGWDVTSIRKQIFLKEELSRFSPDAVIVTAAGSQANGMQLGAQIKQKSSAQIFLVYKKRIEVEAASSSIFSGFFHSPIDPKEVVRTLARYSGPRMNLIVERYEKIFGVPFQDQEIATSLKENKRVKAENLVVKEDTLTGKDLARKKILDQLANLEDRPWSTDSPVMKKLLREKELRPDLDVEKQGFVRKLFTKKN